MHQSLMYFSEMNQAVPGSFASPLMESSFECRVPSPSEWSDVCRSPPLLHSPPHFSDYVDKIKEEPYSPNPVYSLRTPPHTIYNVYLPLMTSEGSGEHSINIAELLAENTALQAQVQQQQVKQKEEKQKAATSISEPIDFLGLIDVKTEFEEVHEPFVTLTQSTGAQCITSPAQITVRSPITSSVPTISGNGGDVLVIALDHYRQSFQEVSMMLNIPSNPSQWTSQNVRSWLQYEASKIEIPLPSLENWQIPGQDLIQLTETQFREVFPKGGNLFYANLEIWKAAFRTTTPLQIPTSIACTVPQEFFQLTQPTTQCSSTEASLLGQGAKPLFVTSTPKSFEVPDAIPRITLPSTPVPSVSVESILDVSAPIVMTSAQQMQEKATVSQVVSPIQSHSILVPTTVTSSGYPLSPKPSTSAGNKDDDIVQVKSRSIQEMETNVSFSAEDNLIHIPTLLTAESSPQTTSITSSRSSRAKSGVSESVSEEPSTSTSTSGRGTTHIHLWQFLKELLHKPQEHGACIRWLDRSKGIFKIEDSVRVAKLWGARKNRPAMNYDKLSRSIRQYYKKGIMKKTERSQRLVYQFCHPYSL